MATEINAGRVAMVPKGTWSSSTAYSRLDVVQYNGSSYVAIQDSTGQNPSTATTYWQLLAGGVDSSNYYTKNETNTKLGGKQDALVSGQNIKTVNNESLLGSGNVTIADGEDGKSAYQSYVDTTTDSPVKTEAEWVASLKGEDGVSLGEVAIADNQITDDATKVLSARQGYLLGQKVNDVDDVPTAGSEKFVKSGGVFDELVLGAVYDVSAKNPTAGINNDGKWESLSALLSDVNLNTLIPGSVRKGGMSVKFVQSSDNKYMQYCCLSDEFSIKVADWQCINASIKFLPNYSYVTRYSKVLIDENKRIIIGEEKSKTIDALRKDISKNYLKNPSIFRYVTRYKSVVLSEDGRMLYYDYKDKTVTADVQQVNQEIHPRLYSIIQALSRSICADYIFDEPSEFEVPNDKYIYGIFDKNGVYVSGFSKNINNN